MNKLTEWLVKPLINEVELPIKVGDTVLMGRFKNKKVKVKSITWNEKGDLHQHLIHCSVGGIQITFH